MNIGEALTEVLFGDPLSPEECALYGYGLGSTSVDLEGIPIVEDSPEVVEKVEQWRSMDLLVSQRRSMVDEMERKLADARKSLDDLSKHHLGLRSELDRRVGFRHTTVRGRGSEEFHSEQVLAGSVWRIFKKTHHLTGHVLYRFSSLIEDPFEVPADGILGCFYSPLNPYPEGPSPQYLLADYAAHSLVGGPVYFSPEDYLLMTFQGRSKVSVIKPKR